MKFFKISAWTLFLLIGQWSIAEEQKNKSDEAIVEKQDVRVEVCSACHQNQYDAMKSSRHWISGDSRTPVNLKECSTCHGDVDEHVQSMGSIDSKGLQTFTPKTTSMTPTEQNAVCKTCHTGPDFLHWEAGGHAAADVGCVSCHSMHKEDKALHKTTQADVCYSCHINMKAMANKPYRHPIREHKMTCTDCHGPHGGAGDADLKTFSINETCYNCHAEKRGPFLWEHIPVSENCNLCHSAHGSINAGMLTRRQPHMCQSCHEPTGHPNVTTGPHQRHSRLALSYRQPGGVDQGPPGSSRGISRFVLGESCMNCHSMVHGSNHPAGANLMR